MKDYHTLCLYIYTVRLFDWNTELGELDTTDPKIVVQNSEELPNICILLQSLKPSLKLENTKYDINELEAAFVYIKSNRLIDELMTRLLVNTNKLTLIEPGMGYPSTKWEGLLADHVATLFNHKNDAKLR